jgi:hypothetical protein
MRRCIKMLETRDEDLPVRAEPLEWAEEIVRMMMRLGGCAASSQNTDADRGPG